MENLAISTSKKMLVSGLRYLLISWGFFLVTKQVVSEDLFGEWVGSTAEVLAGIAVMMVVILWRWLNLRFDLKTLVALAQKPAAPTPGAVETAIEAAKTEVKQDNSLVASV